jgi:hypothetical protein
MINIPCGDQLITNKRGGPGVPRTGCNTSGFCEQLIMTNGYPAKLSNRLAKITFSAASCIAVP